MVYITYAKTSGMYASQDEISICKKVLNGDSFEITNFYMSPRTSQPYLNLIMIKKNKNMFIQTHN